MKIAIIGSGIGGLSCAWFLSREHQVTLYEAHDRLGMGAHAVEVPDFSSANGSGGVLVDMPMRVFFPEYYPTLSSIYEEADIATEPLEYAASFSRLNGKLIFRYRNYLVGGASVPFIHGADLANMSTTRIGAKLLAFLFRLPTYSEANRKHCHDETLREFIARVNLSREVTEKFLLPAYAGICTCSYDNLLNYPARIILNYLNSGLILSSMRRASLGVEDVVQRLSQHVATIKLATPVQAVMNTRDGVDVVPRNGKKASYDHVVVATQADHAVGMLQGAGFTRERAVLTAFDYEGFEVLIHKDSRLAPGNPGRQSPVNYFLSQGSRAPMVTIPLNSVHKELAPQVPIYQTWNPLIEPRPQDTFKSARLFRPVINANSDRAQLEIQGLHREPGRRVWLCGSYASPGIPLQESAAFSAQQIAQKVSQQPRRAADTNSASRHVA